MRVLFVEDIEESIVPSRRLLEEKGISCSLIHFGDVPSQLQNLRPDIVVLDLMEGATAVDDPEGRAGGETYDVIWDTRFCPIIIYSSNPDLFQGEPHPFVAHVQKGSGSEIKVFDQVMNFKSHAEIINNTENEVDKALRIAIREIAPLIFDAGTGIAISKDSALQHFGRRRIAAMMDEHVYDIGEIEAWGQYIWPPLGGSIKLGDILQANGSAKSSPESFKVVLSPSCDLVCEGGREPLIREVLVANCESSEVLLTKAQISEKDDRLSKALAGGFVREYYPLPALPDIIPHMAVNMKRLQLIPIDSIKQTGGEYVRVASIDSPFREQLAWAYLHTGCRPGVPERNYKQWAEQIIGNHKKTKEATA